jgi:hypothetical protein
MTGLFGANAVYFAGFYIVGISSLRLGTQFLYTFMIYISNFPADYIIRSTNFNKERNLEIFGQHIKAKDEIDAIGMDRFS